MTTTHMFQVPDISCGHCKAAIEDTVGRVAGVTGVDVDIDAKTVAVTATDVTAEALVAAIDEAGYDVA